MLVPKNNWNARKNIEVFQNIDEKGFAWSKPKPALTHLREIVWRSIGIICIFHKCNQARQFHRNSSDISNFRKPFRKIGISVFSTE